VENVAARSAFAIAGFAAGFLLIRSTSRRWTWDVGLNAGAEKISSLRDEND